MLKLKLKLWMNVKLKLKLKFEINIKVEIENEIVDVGGRGFVEVKEFGVPDVVKSMSWCGENICLGIRREYMILNASNGALSEVFTSGRLAPPLVVPLPSGELLLGKVLFSTLNLYLCCMLCVLISSLLVLLG
jgi:hypothetical protein